MSTDADSSFLRHSRQPHSFNAVLDDLRDSAPDLVLHGGDLAEGGARPVEIIDAIRDFGWHGVVGNTDEVLWAPERLDEISATAPTLRPLKCLAGSQPTAVPRRGAASR